MRRSGPERAPRDSKMQKGDKQAAGSGQEDVPANTVSYRIFPKYVGQSANLVSSISTVSVGPIPEHHNSVVATIMLLTECWNTIFQKYTKGESYKEIRFTVYHPELFPLERPLQLRTFNLSENIGISLSMRVSLRALEKPNFNIQSEFIIYFDIIY